MHTNIDQVVRYLNLPNDTLVILKRLLRFAETKNLKHKRQFDGYIKYNSIRIYCNGNYLERVVYNGYKIYRNKQNKVMFKPYQKISSFIDFEAPIKSNGACDKVIGGIGSKPIVDFGSCYSEYIKDIYLYIKENADDKGSTR